MQIDIRVSKRSEDIAEQVRAYAEYRIFSAIAENVLGVQSVDVYLRTSDIPGIGVSAMCVLSARLPCRTIRVKARTSHATAAIDKAAARLAHAIAVEAASGAAIRRS